jgi:hypothetical protein
MEKAGESIEEQKKEQMDAQPTAPTSGNSNGSTGDKASSVGGDCASIDDGSSSGSGVVKGRTRGWGWLMQTELCRAFLADGRCVYGDRCIYAHGMDSLRARLQPTNYKTLTCAEYRKHNICNRQERCRFVHCEFRIPADDAGFVWWLINPEDGTARYERFVRLICDDRRLKYFKRVTTVPLSCFIEWYPPPARLLAALQSPHDLRGLTAVPADYPITGYADVDVALKADLLLSRPNPQTPSPTNPDSGSTATSLKPRKNASVPPLPTDASAKSPPTIVPVNSIL